MSTKAELLAELETKYSQMITDRTIQDVLNLVTISKKRYSDMSSAEQTVIRSSSNKGAYNYSDLNRVSSFCNVFVEYLAALGYRTDEYVSLRANWGGNNTPTANELDAYIQAITLLKNRWAYQSISIPSSITTGLTVQQANNIEIALKRCLDIVNNMTEYDIYSGQMVSNQFSQFSGGNG